MAELSPAAADRAAGALLGLAAGEGLATAGRWGELTASALAGSGGGRVDPRPDAAAALVAGVPLALAGRVGDLATVGFADAETVEACLLWGAAVEHALAKGELDLGAGLVALAADRAQVWADRLTEAGSRPADELLSRSGAEVVSLVQAAWAAILATPVPEEDPRAGLFRAQHLRAAVEAAAATGSAAVAAATGALLGATYGASAVPAAWRRILHDDSGGRPRDLVAAGAAAAGSPLRTPDYSLDGDLSALGRHPHDEDVWLGGYKSLRQPPTGVTTVVSVCPVAAGDVPAGVEQIDVPLADSPSAADNPNLAFVLHDTAGLIQTLRAEGRTVLLHGVQAASRVPVVAGAYAFRRYDLTVSGAFTDVRAVLRRAQLNDAFREALEALAPVPEAALAPRPQGDGRTRAESERPTRWNSIDGWPEGRTLNRRNR